MQNLKAGLEQPTALSGISSRHWWLATGSAYVDGGGERRSLIRAEFDILAPEILQPESAARSKVARPGGAATGVRRPRQNGLAFPAYLLWSCPGAQLADQSAICAYRQAEWGALIADTATIMPRLIWQPTLNLRDSGDQANLKMASRRS